MSNKRVESYNLGRVDAAEVEPHAGRFGWRSNMRRTLLCLIIVVVGFIIAGAGSMLAADPLEAEHARVKEDTGERVRREYVESSIKLYFVGEENCAIHALRNVFNWPQYSHWPTNSPSRQQAFQFLESLRAGQKQDQKLEECRKNMTPEEFLQYVEKTRYKWW